MKWRPLLYRSSSRQAGQAIAPAQYSNLKCVSRFRATLYYELFVSVQMRPPVADVRHTRFISFSGPTVLYF